MKKGNSNQELKDCIQSIFEENEYRHVHLKLKNHGYKVNHKAVRRIMRKPGLKGSKFSKKTREYSSYKGNVGKNRIKLYLSLIMDLYNGEILSYGIGRSPTLDLAIKPLKEAIEIGKDSEYRTTIHSDQGWQYQHKKW